LAIQIIIDSASDISEQEAEKLGVRMIPMLINFGDETYLDGVDLLPKAFYEKLTTAKDLPKTSQITPFRFEEAFRCEVEKGNEVVAITISSKLSGTYEAAKQAAEKFPDKVFVVDSLSATIGERLLCAYALALIQSGKSAQEIVNALEKKKEKLCVMGVLETLEYLKRGGRISSAVAFVGGVLNLKPVVKIVDGEVKMIGKARGQKKGAEIMNDLISHGSGIDFSLPFGVLWTGTEDCAAMEYIQNNRYIFKEGADVPKYVVGSTIGTHVGPGVFGVAFFEKE